ncbi:hypothetical protein CBQ26_16725 [Deinococcus indicus]|uniref:Secreted protein n=1 Tax=Deinococcus indicus TaxID=223556 RepID=A0A246BFY5_9DEIO|nr:hypothetical protein CBQ26_18950 [Deinococcus indicus]OWL94143.1 hypothetical protein CBQ26_16725 [Deinococcus indicus]
MSPPNLILHATTCLTLLGLTAKAALRAMEDSWQIQHLMMCRLLPQHDHCPVGYLHCSKWGIGICNYSNVRRALLSDDVLGLMNLRPMPFLCQRDAAVRRR